MSYNFLGKSVSLKLFLGYDLANGLLYSVCSSTDSNIEMSAQYLKSVQHDDTSYQLDKVQYLILKTRKLGVNQP